ncbi:uncharacterized protein LOC124274944 [Haliotis rubra]|uniref:uncharacterized protein LOC124274944 n=1 Tax=Haliotis rubra TaxID=36100 RepID=UPI001EE54337|nr:uncharacterized protein LOC124274944 [Haliotis rubra]XP_046566276.1 uncharacterized protein LOC124274944 [Haliotis rubra]
MHNRHPSSRHHDVVGMSPEVKVRRRRQVFMCKDHKDEVIKLMCKDCKKAVCQTCCIIYHRNCRCVVEIESEISAMKSELEKNKHNLLERCAEIKTLVDKLKTTSKEESKHYLQMESDIKSATNKAIDMLKQKEKKLLIELKEMSYKHIGQLKADIESGEMSVQVYQQQAEVIDQALQSESDMDVYEMYQGREAVDVDAVTDVKERGRITRTVFRQDTGQLSRALDDLQLGEIDVQYESVLDMKATPMLHNTINATVGDTEEASLLDITVVVVNGVDTVVFTDGNNKSVKSFYTSNDKVCHSKLRLRARPSGITRLKHNQVAVTVPVSRQIVTVEVNPDLVLLSTITTSKKYFGITSLTPSTVAAGSDSPPCIDILDMTGHVMRSISPLCNGNNILQRPSFLCTMSKGNILVSDCLSTCVICLTPWGDVVFTYSPTGATALEHPVGITATSTGDILVVDYFLGRVIHLTESGKFVRNILTSQDGIEDSTGLCLDRCGNMYVCMSNVVKIFSLH